MLQHVPLSEAVIWHNCPEDNSILHNRKLMLHPRWKLNPKEWNTCISLWKNPQLLHWYFLLQCFLREVYFYWWNEFFLGWFNLFWLQTTGLNVVYLEYRDDCRFVAQTTYNLTKPTLGVLFTHALTLNAFRR